MALSKIKTNSISNPVALTAPVIDGGGYSQYQFRNRTINSAMAIDQRNNGAAITGEGYIVDRWRCWFNQSYSFQRVADAPAGFQYSIKVTKTSTTQSSYGLLAQYIEGYNVADLGWGTANAQTVTLSFWVKSSITGTYTVSFYNSAEDRSYPASYTINQANTWEYKSMTVPGDTSGTWLKDNGKGIALFFNFGGAAANSVLANSWYAQGILPASNAAANLGTTNGATFFLTGVQMEKGTSATPFEHRPYGLELTLCQRYYQNTKIGSTEYYPYMQRQSSFQGRYCLAIMFPVQMRAIPSFTVFLSPDTSAGGNVVLGYPYANIYCVNADVVASLPANYSWGVGYNANAEL